MNDRLERFREAQERDYETVFMEIRSGKKTGHWMWYMFPQIAGLGRSETAKYYEISDLNEAEDYIEDPFLGGNLIKLTQALLELDTDNAGEIMGCPDNMKLKSSMTLFALAKPDCGVFERALDKFFHGEKDQNTLEILNGQLERNANE